MPNYTMQKMIEHKKWVVIIACILPYLGFWLYGLTDLDEGFYGAVTKEMLRRGDWITPFYNGEPWFEKPILSYWLSMPFAALFGNEFGARLPSFLCTLGTGWLIYSFVKKHRTENIALLSALAYSTSLLVVGIGRQMMTDAPLVLCLLFCFFNFYDSLVYNSKAHRIYASIFLGLSALAKGPVGPALFVFVALFSYIFLKEYRVNWKGGWVLGSLIFFALVSTWYVPCYLINKDLFVQKFLIEQNIGRFKGGDLAHRVPWWSHPFYYPLTLILATIQWFFGGIKSDVFKPKRDIQDQPVSSFRIFLWILVLVPLVFFSISGSKLPHYILPSVAPLTILLIDSLLSKNDEKFGQLLTTGVISSIILFGLANYVLFTYQNNQFGEVQAYAMLAQNNQDRLVFYSPEKPEIDPEITLELQTTSYPSILFYYDKPMPTSSFTNQDNWQPGNYAVLVRTSEKEEFEKTWPITNHTGSWDTSAGDKRFSLYRFTFSFEQ